MRIFLLIIIWSTSLIPLPVFSAQSEFEEIAENLIGPANLAAIAIEQQSYCLQLVETDFLPKKMYEFNPNMFEGITPETPEWNKLNKAYDKFVNDVCGHMEYEKYRKTILKIYAEEFSEIGVSIYDQISTETLAQVDKIVSERMVKNTDDAAVKGLENYEKNIFKVMREFRAKQP